jgi:hypothetical protein
VRDESTVKLIWCIMPLNNHAFNSRKWCSTFRGGMEWIHSPTSAVQEMSFINDADEDVDPVLSCLDLSCLTLLY